MVCEGHVSSQDTDAVLVAQILRYKGQNVRGQTPIVLMKSTRSTAGGGRGSLGTLWLLLRNVISLVSLLCIDVLLSSWTPQDYFPLLLILAC